MRRRAVLYAAVAAGLMALTWARIELVGSLIDQGWLATYDDLATRILAGDIPRVRASEISPLYLGVVVALRAVGLGVTAIRGLQIATLSVCALFCALAAKRYGGWTAAVVAGLAVFGNRAALVIASDLDPRTLLLFCLSAAIFLLPGRPLFAGAFLGLGAATDEAGFAILVAVALWRRRQARPVVAGAIVPLALVAILSLAALGPPSPLHRAVQFHAGNNPLSTGCGGTAPRIIVDVQASSRLASAEPVYRMLGEKSGRSPAAYWISKSIAFFREHPAAALKRLAWKSLLTVHHYDVYALVTASRKAWELSRYPAVPLGVVFVLSAAAFVLRRERRELVPVAIFAVVPIVLLTLFVVTARERNLLVAPLAVLAGVGAAEIVALARVRIERALLVFGAVIILSALLGIEGPPMQEDKYKWWSALGLESRLLGPESPQRLFDIALGFQERGDWRTSAAALATLVEYRPLRENRAVSSVAYHRARAAMRLGRPRAEVVDLLDRAAREAPGDPNVLALRAVTADRTAARSLDALHDPFTRDFALALAYADTGALDRADALLRSLASRVPEWRQPAAAGRVVRAAVATRGSGRAGGVERE